MTAAADPRLRLARKTVGEVRAIDVPRLPSRPLHVADSLDRHYVVKQHHNTARFEQEVRAYSTYLTAMRDITAGLVAYDVSDRTLLLSHLPGSDADAIGLTASEESLVHHRAGTALRRLHDGAYTSKSAEQIGSGLARRMRQWTQRADHAGLISRNERRRLHAWARCLSDTEMEAAVCHLDYQPRNWRLHRDELFVVDFEHARPDARIRDFARLQRRRWVRHPHLREAFFSGYGRTLSDAEDQLLHLFGAIEAVTALVRGHETGDAALSAHGRALLNRLT
jgi:hypothetical protein